jgi:RNA polymerase sigma-70 factor, ECF subfamily
MDAEPLTMSEPAERTALPRNAVFDRLLEEHGSALLAMLRRLCPQRGDADDLFQETAVRVWKQFADRPWFRSPRSWLLTIGYRVFIDWVRAKKRRICGVDGVEVIDSKSLSPPESLEGDEQRDRLRLALRQLPENLREIVVLHYTGDLTLKQIAEAMKIPVGTVKSRLHAALNELRSLLP